MKRSLCDICNFVLSCVKSDLAFRSLDILYGKLIHERVDMLETSLQMKIKQLKLWSSVYSFRAGSRLCLRF